jgi:hypothetical protein
MAQTNPGSIATNESNVVRSAVTTADSATLNDTNFPPADATNCAGWKSVLVHVTFDGGTGPTATIIPLYRAGSTWLPGTATAAIAAGTLAQVTTYGRLVAFRVSAITGSPTSVTVRCAGFEPFRFDGPARG